MTDTEYAELYLRKAQSAKDAGIEFELTFAEYKRLRKMKRCAYSGEVFSEYENGVPVDKWRSRTLDRIDNTLGYIKGNVVAVCKGVNQFKAVWENPNNELDLLMVERIIRNVVKSI